MAGVVLFSMMTILMKGMELSLTSKFLGRVAMPHGVTILEKGILPLYL